jgi:hypothetical protein
MGRTMCKPSSAARVGEFIAGGKNKRLKSGKQGAEAPCREVIRYGTDAGSPSGQPIC